MDKEDLLDALKRHGYKIAIPLIAAACVFIYSLKSHSNKELSKRSDFEESCRLQMELIADKPLSADSIASLSELIDRYPELKASIAGPLTLALLSEKQVERAEQIRTPYSKDESIADVVRLFSDISFLIEKGDKANAAKAARNLETTLKQSGQFTSLRAYNLLRLSLLENDSSHFKLASTLASAPALFALFQEGTLDLSNYFATLERKCIEE